MAQTKEENPEVESWEEVILIYNSALKEMNTKLEILNEEFKHVHSYNPIEHISSRLKSSEGIVKKLKKHEREVNIENMVNKSRGAFAYTMFDVNGSVSDEAAAKLTSLGGVIRVRVI